jgi:hypothetical protein
MPAKSRRSRRTIPQSRKAAAGQVTAIPSGSNYDSPTQIKTEQSYSVKSKSDQAPLVEKERVVTELKMIGLVTVVILILLMISYYIFR